MAAAVKAAAALAAAVAALFFLPPATQAQTPGPPAQTPTPPPGLTPLPDYVIDVGGSFTVANEYMVWVRPNVQGVLAFLTGFQALAFLVKALVRKKQTTVVLEVKDGQ